MFAEVTISTNASIEVVIASEAKQSPKFQHRGLLRRFTPRNDRATQVSCRQCLPESFRLALLDKPIVAPH